MKDYQYHIFSPYRVCPLGAHVDHQHGLVTGFAIDKGVDLWFNVNDCQRSKVKSRGRRIMCIWSREPLKELLILRLTNHHRCVTICGATMRVARSMLCASVLN